MADKKLDYKKDFLGILLKTIDMKSYYTYNTE